MVMSQPHTCVPAIRANQRLVLTQFQPGYENFPQFNAIYIVDEIDNFLQ